MPEPTDGLRVEAVRLVGAGAARHPREDESGVVELDSPFALLEGRVWECGYHAP